ncbi:rubredoxin [Nocardia cyriacigeorgica]|uniref:Rubredoxin n=1 Tax=Nocardia cyriacigeorgica TaxID=135487 RepID=A0A5R8P754_9NOCA|nr:rubredoxin [Nocardia cyriacigeorgica]TLF98286.1 rubredoxin [Nocardia cyriacigeorgica]
MSPTTTAYKVYRCAICGWEYDEAAGSPDEGLAPGTRWEDVPDDWTCPDCGAEKADFEMVEVGR